MRYMRYLSSVTVALVFLAGQVMAQSSGAQVVAGSAQLQQNGGNLTVSTGTNRTIINWNSFGVAPGTLTHFQQPGVTAATLNRVTGSGVSGIYGTLSSNGRLYLINPNGIVIGPSGVVQTAGFVASTLDISDAQFLSGGTLNFTGDSNAAVVNLGTIRAAGGDVYLIARHVENRGAIDASGNVGLAAGTDVLLYEEGEERLYVRPVGDFVGGTGVLNTGAIQAASAELKASGNLYSLAINQQGLVRATGSVNDGGRVILRADGGNVRVGGTVLAQRLGTDGRTQGGEIQVLGEVVELDDGARLDVSGQTGGGTVNVGGSFQGSGPLPNARSVFVSDLASIYADATESGNGGTVIVWSDDSTTFHGFVSARALGQGNGGFAEISGKVTLDVTGLADLRAAYGEGGTLLLDPGRVRIVSGNNTGPNAFGNLYLQTQLGLGNVVINTSAATNGNPENIAVNAEVFWNSEFSLTLNAGQNINAHRSIVNDGTGAVILNAGLNGDGDVVIGGQNNDGFVSVGSRQGLTQVTGTNLRVRGSDEYFGAGAMLGVTGPGATGDIVVNVSGDVRVIGGSAPGGSAQIGHAVGFFGAAINVAAVDSVGPPPFGGIGSALDGADITITAGGQVVVQGGTVSDSYDFGESRIAIDDVGGFGPPSSSARIGHVVYGGLGIVPGIEGLETLAEPEAGFIYGDIRIQAGDNVILRGGGYDGESSEMLSMLNFAQVGHSMFGGLVYGEPTVEASGAAVNVEPAGVIQGNIDVVSGGRVAVNGGDGGILNYAQIGHGGPFGSGDITGNISVTAADNVAVHGGSGLIGYSEFGLPSVLNYGAIGHAGMLYSGNRSGNIGVTSTGGSVRVLGGDAILAHARIGHGGFGFDFGGFLGDLGGEFPIGVYAEPGLEGILDPFGDIGGNISVNALNDVVVRGGTGILSFAHVGHFGGAGSDVSGNIGINAQNGDVLLTGRGLLSSAQVGHVAPDIAFPMYLLSELFEIELPYIEPSFGSLSGNISVSAGGDVILTNLGDISLPGLGELAEEAPALAYAAIGHGDQFGLLVSEILGAPIPLFFGDIQGDIGVTAGRNVVLQGAPIGEYGAAFAMIGHMAFLDFYEGEGEASVNAEGITTIHGSTTIGVSLAEPHANGSGRFIMNGFSAVTSGFGASDQIRVYMPNPGSYSIEDGAIFTNNLDFVNFLNGTDPGSVREFFGYTYNPAHAISPYTPIYSFYYYPRPGVDPVEPTILVPTLPISYDDFDRYLGFGWIGDVKGPGVRNMLLYMSQFIRLYRGDNVLTGGETVGAGTKQEQE